MIRLSKNSIVEHENTVLMCNQLKALVEEGHIYANNGMPPLLVENDPKDDTKRTQVQPASIDLRLGPEAWEVDCDFTLKPGETMEQALKHIHAKPVQTENHILEPSLNGKKQTYLIVKLQEGFDLPAPLWGEESTKSFAGRLDLDITGMLDRYFESHPFNTLPPGYRGGVYVLMRSNSWRIQLNVGKPVIQIRMNIGDPLIPDEQLKKNYSKHPLLCQYKNNKTTPIEQGHVKFSDGLILSTDLERDIIAYTAKPSEDIIAIGKKKEYHPKDFHNIQRKPKQEEDYIAPQDVFHIMCTYEWQNVPRDQCADLKRTANEISIDAVNNYAGFSDPGFARPLTLEARFRRPTRLYHRTPIARDVHLQLHDTVPPELAYGGQKLQSHFSQQPGIALSYVFKDEVEW